MKKFLVTCEETCPECDGKGEITNPEYAEYAEFEKKVISDLRLPSNSWLHKDVLAVVVPWLEDRGYYNYPEDLVWDVAECDTCNGTGTYRHTIDLLDAIKDMKFEDTLRSIISEQYEPVGD